MVCLDALRVVWVLHGASASLSTGARASVSGSATK